MSRALREGTGRGAERCAGGNGPEVQDEAGRDRVERNGMQSGMERGGERRSRTAGTERRRCGAWLAEACSEVDAVWFLR